MANFRFLNLNKVAEAIEEVQDIFRENRFALNNIVVDLIEGYKVTINGRDTDIVAESDEAAIKKVLSNFSGWYIAEELAKGKSVTATTKDIIMVTVTGEGLDGYGEDVEAVAKVSIAKDEEGYKGLLFLLYEKGEVTLLEDGRWL